MSEDDFNDEDHEAFGAMKYRGLRESELPSEPSGVSLEFTAIENGVKQVFTVEIDDWKAIELRRTKEINLGILWYFVNHDSAHRSKWLKELARESISQLAGQ